MAIKYWNLANAGGNWNVTNNWSPSGVPVGGDDVFVTGSVTANRTIVLDTNTTVRSISFGNQTSTAFRWIVGGGIVSLSSGVWSYPAGAYVSADSTSGINDGCGIITTTINSSQVLKKVGAGVVMFTAANSVNWTGGILVETGSLMMGGSGGATGVFGSGPITLLEGTSLGANAGSFTTANTLNINGAATIFNAGSSQQIFSGQLNINNNLTMLSTAGNISVTGIVAGTGDLLVSGSKGSTMRETFFQNTGTNTYSGRMTVDGNARISTIVWPPSATGNTFPNLRSVNIATSPSRFHVYSNANFTIPYTLSGSGVLVLLSNATVTAPANTFSNLTGSDAPFMRSDNVWLASSGIELYSGVGSGANILKLQEFPSVINWRVEASTDVNSEVQYSYVGSGGSYNIKGFIITQVSGSAAQAFNSTRAIHKISADHAGSTPLILNGEIKRDGAADINIWYLYLSGTNTSNNTIAGPITQDATHGTLALVKQGSGVWALSGVNTYGGSTVISAGTLIVSETGSLGTGNYSGTIINNGIFHHSSSASQVLSGPLTGTGDLIKSAAGSLILSGANTYSGTTTVRSGTIVIPIQRGTSSGTVTVTGSIQFTDVVTEPQVLGYIGTLVSSGGRLILGP